MKKFAERTLSVVLAIVMIVSCFSLTAFAEDKIMNIKVSTVSGCPGDTVNVTVELENNPGLSSLKFNVNFDDAYLTLSNVTFAEGYGSYVTAPEPYGNPQTISLLSPMDEINNNGLFATLSFTVSTTAEDNVKVPVTITYDEDEVLDGNLDRIDLLVTDGYVNIYHGIPGDIDGNTKVNNKDAILLFRYIAGWNVTVDEGALDCNGDGKVNNKDAIILFRYIAGWPDIVITRGQVCDHELNLVAGKDATCTEDGSVMYWECTVCGKLFSNSTGTKEITQDSIVIPATGHEVVIDPAIPATYTEKGLTEGSHCSKCNLILVAQEEYGPLVADTSNIIYKYNYVETTTINGTKTIVADSYVASQTVNNTNPNTYAIGTGVASFEDIILDGYDFLGWYESPEVGAKRVYSISADETGDKTLYGVWAEKTNSITYRLYQTPLEDSIDEKYCTFRTSKGLADLPNPTIYNYVFLGWFDNDGNEVTEIPVGTSGDIVLNAYWTSKRNLTKYNPKYDEPIVVEDTDTGVIYYAYELGTIENIPISENIWTIQSVAGLSQQKSETYTTSLTQTKADAISNTISNSTVDSGTWTLSEGWNDTTSVTEEWAQQHGMTVEEANERCTTSSNTYSVTDSNGGNKSHTKNGGTTAVSYDSQNHTQEEAAEFGQKLSDKTTKSNEVDVGVKVKAGPVEANADYKHTWGSEVSNENSHTRKENDATNTHTGTDTTTVKTTVDVTNTTWNNSTTSTNTLTDSQKSSISKELSTLISNKTGYGSSYTQTGQSSNTQGFSNTESNSVNTSSQFTWSKLESKTVTNTYSTDGKSEGCYRLVIAGKAHVFGVVGYDIASKSYFTYTYSVMDDEQYEFLDFAPDLNFNDCENGVIPFEIPFDICDYSMDVTLGTSGLGYKTNSINRTANVTKYTGDSLDVTIPNYITVSGVVYRVTGISASVFAGKNIRSIMLSKFIEEIPAGAFKNCTSLEQISGYYSIIGDEAFSGCVNLHDYYIPTGVYSIGINAFNGVSEIVVNALSEDNALKYSCGTKEQYTEEEKNVARELTNTLINSVVSSGADNITLSIVNIIDGCEITVDVPEIHYFGLFGSNEKLLPNLKVTSKSEETVLSNLRIVDSTRIPLVIESDKLTLDTVNVSSQGYCLMIPDETEITLVRDSSFDSANGKAIVCKNPTFISEETDSVYGYLEVSGNVYVCGVNSVNEIVGIEDVEVKSGEIIIIPEADFDKYIQGSYSVSFDENGGNALAETEKVKTVYFGSAFGELPVPTRDHYTFDGWFTEANGGVQVTETDLYNESKDTVLYAHWTCVPYTVNWNNGTNCSIMVERTESPNAGASIGALNSGSVIYYGDVLHVTYAADTGYSLSGNGKTDIIVDGNVSSSDIYASATANEYTYNIVYKSSNGTSLGSSTATYRYGTTNTISAPDKTSKGYDTPADKTVSWDSVDAKTITFTYQPTSVSSTKKTGTCGDELKYSAELQYRNRTANSVEVRVKWTTTIKKGYYDVYGQQLDATVGDTTKSVTVAEFNTWKNKADSDRSETGTTGWIKVNLSTTNKTTASVKIYYYQFNSNGTDMYKYNGTECVSATWKMDIPAY